METSRIKIYYFYRNGLTEWQTKEDAEKAAIVELFKQDENGLYRHPEEMVKYQNSIEKEEKRRIALTVYGRSRYMNRMFCAELPMRALNKSIKIDSYEPDIIDFNYIIEYAKSKTRAKSGRSVFTSFKAAEDGYLIHAYRVNARDFSDPLLCDNFILKEKIRKLYGNREGKKRTFKVEYFDSHSTYGSCDDSELYATLPCGRTEFESFKDEMFRGIRKMIANWKHLDYARIWDITDHRELVNEELDRPEYDHLRVFTDISLEEGER